MTRTEQPQLRTALLAFVEAHQAGEVGIYRYAAGCNTPTLYSSCYAAMIRHLLDDLDGLAMAEREAWVANLQTFQESDGLFEDPVIYNQGWYAGDPLWCGRPHLTFPLIATLSCLGAVAARPFTWLEPWRDRDALVRWLEERDWGEGISWAGNEIMNVGVLLQYARDFHGDARAGKAVAVLLEWLATHQVNPSTGVWGTMGVSDLLWRSNAVQAAYHWWSLFFYDGMQPPYTERAIDTLLTTQNPLGGFGWGVHNPGEPFLSSACEDIDSIDPLCRMLQFTFYRRSDIEAALARAADWVLTNQMPDGGFVFIRNQPFEYGHPQLRGETNQGAMFPTWFRLLSLALVGRALPEHPLGQITGCAPWRFLRCPGMQF
jgi:hypothetical protein